MDVTTLEKANELNQKIKELSEFLKQYEEEFDKVYTREPRLLIEFYGDDSEKKTYPVPKYLSDLHLKFIKKQAVLHLQSAVIEFNDL